MWDEKYLYPSRWTEPGSEPNFDQLEMLIDNTMATLAYQPSNTDHEQLTKLKQYLTCEPMWKAIVNERVIYGS